jgi:hypothetical protein
MSYIIETGQGYVTLEHIVNRCSTDINEARCFQTASEARFHAETHSLLDWMVGRRFVKTLDALDIWAARSPERVIAWNDDNIMTTAGVNAAVALNKRHATEVQEAFFQDTKGLNSRDNCGLITPEEAIRISGWKKP